MITKARVLVTGGGTFLGDSIAAALLAEGVEVTLLVRPEAEEKIGVLAQHVRTYTADVWDPASLKGRARGHSSVIHTVGSMSADPAQGLTFQWLNFVSARNVANMCVSSGVPHMVLLSSVRAPWVNGQYIAAKREAEAYIPRVGLRATIIRAPIAYMRGTRRRPFYALMSLLGAIPPLSWLVFSRVAPLPVDVLARGVARIALEPRQKDATFSARDLRKRNSSRERRSGVSERETQIQQQPLAYPVDDDSPFG
ncbi:MAG: NAD(P)H-binding protein, partial [Chloroflexota bacterium]